MSIYYSADCKGIGGSEPGLKCSHSTLTVSWPTDATFSADVTEIPSVLYSTLTERLNAVPVLKIVIISMNPP